MKVGEKEKGMTEFLSMVAPIFGVNSMEFAGLPGKVLRATGHDAGWELEAHSMIE